MWSSVVTIEATMKRVGVREFRDHATRYLSGDEVIAIERHGQPVGLYIPTATGRTERSREAIERLDATVRRILERTGLTEDELSDLFNLRKPLAPEPDERDADP